VEEESKEEINSGKVKIMPKQKEIDQETSPNSNQKKKLDSLDMNTIRGTATHRMLLDLQPSPAVAHEESHDTENEISVESVLHIMDRKQMERRANNKDEDKLASIVSSDKAKRLD